MNKKVGEGMLSLIPPEPGQTTSQDKPGQKPPIVPKSDPNVDPIEEMVGALTDFIIVFPGGGWEETIPDPLKQRLPLDRLAHQMRCSKGQAQWDEACDLEALLYLYPASLTAPMSEQWSRIYLYLGTKCLGDRLPGDIRQDSLSDYDMGELMGLKRWIQRKKVQARKQREKGKPAAPVEVEPEELKLF